ncbi:hypothetical protein DFH09DRAFT_1153039 [Mycena vulgaris]|nr:hypothetical protein DFH09DRAFT_1153039 [Mycena vulgaris]
MFFNTSLLAAVLIGSANAFTGIATDGLPGTTNCGCPNLWCPASNGPFAVWIPSALRRFNGIFNSGAGTQNIVLSQTAFTALEDSPTDTSLSVTWAWN